MKEIIIIAGPNGAGKTSFANEYLPYEREGLLFLNADEIARELLNEGASPASIDVAAGREMIHRIDQVAASGAEFIFETTLATLIYQRRIRQWQRMDYWVSLIYLKLPSVEDAIRRVERRVAAGGHGIPEPVIRQRFMRSLDYLERLYKPIVNDWSVWNSLEGNFEVVEVWDD